MQQEHGGAVAPAAPDHGTVTTGCGKFIRLGFEEFHFVGDDCFWCNIHGFGLLMVADHLMAIQT